MLKYLACNRFLKLVFLSGLTVTLPVGAAHAQNVDQDVRCYIVSLSFVEDAQLGKNAGLYSQFYLGKIVSRMNSTQFRAAVLRQRKALINTNVKSEMNRCSRVAQQRSQTFEIVAER